MQILRPLIYVFLLVKYGRKSYTPVKVAFCVDIVSILFSIYRFKKASNVSKGDPSTHAYRLRSLEKQQINKRIWEALLKYLIRDPIFDDFTKKFAFKVFTGLRISPKIFDLLISIVNSFRYISIYEK